MCKCPANVLEDEEVEQAGWRGEALMLSIRCSQIELVLQQSSSHVSIALPPHAQYAMATVTKPHPQHHKLAHSHTQSMAAQDETHANLNAEAL